EGVESGGGGAAVIELIAALAQQVADHILAWPLSAPGRGDRNKVLRRCELRVKTGVDGVKDLLGCIGVHRYHLFQWSPGSNHIFRRSCRAAVAFRIQSASLNSAPQCRMPFNPILLPSAPCSAW